MKPEVGFEFQFAGQKDGRKYLHSCKVTEVIPEKRLAYTWRYEDHPGSSVVSFDLLAQGNKTESKLTHVGLETFPPLPDFARQNFLQGWSQILGSSLKQRLEQDAPTVKSPG